MEAPEMFLDVVRTWHTRVGVLTLNVLLLLLGTGIVRVPQPFLATLIAVFLILFLPGLLLLSLVSKSRASIPEQLAVSFVLSLGLWSGPGVVLMRLHASLETLKWIVITVTLLLCVISIVRSQRAKSDSRQILSYRGTKTYRRLDLGTFLLGISVLVAVLIMVGLVVSMATILQPSDRWSYTATMRHYLDTAHFGTTGIYISDSTPIPARHSMSVWEPLMALVTKVAQVELIDMYSFYLPPILVVISYLALYNLAKEILKDRKAALVVCLLQTLYYLTSILPPPANLPGRWMVEGFAIIYRSQEDKWVLLFAVLPMAQLVALRYFSIGNKIYVGLVVLVITALTFLHPMGLVYFGISFGAFASFSLLLGWSKKKFIHALLVLAILLVLLVVPLIQQREMSALAGFERFTELLPRYGLLIFSEQHDLYMVNPRYLVYPQFVALALLLSPLLVRYVRRNLGAQFLFSNVVAVLLLIYNPVMAPILGKAVTPRLLWRITLLLPASLIIGFFALEGVKWLQQRYSDNSQLARLFPLLPAILILAGGILSRQRIMSGVHYLQEFKESGVSPEHRAVLTFLREHGVPGSVILAEPWMTYDIPSMVGHSYGLIFRGLPTRLPSAPKDLDRFYQAPSLLNSRLEILQKYDARYLVLQTDSPLEMRFSELYPAFQRIYRNREFSLYEARPGWQENSLVHHLIAASTLYASGDYAEAEEQCKLALQVAPDNVWAWEQLADVHVAQGEFDQAIAEYERVIAASPDEVWLRLHLGEIYDAQGETEKAVAQYQQVIMLEPDSAEAYRRLVEIYKTAGKLEKYIPFLIKARELPPYSIWPYLWLGYVYRGQGKLDEAIAEYQNAIELKPTSAEAYIQLGDLYKAQGRTGEAIALYQAAARRNRSAAWPHIELGKVYLEEAGRDETD